MNSSDQNSSAFIHDVGEIHDENPSETLLVQTQNDTLLPDPSSSSSSSSSQLESSSTTLPQQDQEQHSTVPTSTLPSSTLPSSSSSSTSSSSSSSSTSSSIDPLNFPFNHCQLKATCRSLGGKLKGADCGSLPDQLAAGVRVFELDVLAHRCDPPHCAEPTPFVVGCHHPGEGVDLCSFGRVGEGHRLPQEQRIATLSLFRWLALIRHWAAENPKHLPIVLVFRLQSDLIQPTYGECGYGESNLQTLQNQILRSFGSSRLFTAADLHLYKALHNGQWPLVKHLRGRILPLIAGHPDTKQRYLCTVGVEPAISVTEHGVIVVVYNAGDGRLWYQTGRYVPEDHNNHYHPSHHNPNHHNPNHPSYHRNACQKNLNQSLNHHPSNLEINNTTTNPTHNDDNNNTNNNNNNKNDNNNNDKISTPIRNDSLTPSHSLSQTPLSRSPALSYSSDYSSQESLDVILRRTKSTLIKIPTYIDQVHWQQHDYIDTGCQPSISVNNTGWMISVCKSDYFPMLYYRIGYLVEHDPLKDLSASDDPRDSRDSRDEHASSSPSSSSSSSSFAGKSHSHHNPNQQQQNTNHQQSTPSLRSLFSPLRKIKSFGAGRLSASAAAAAPFSWAPSCVYSCKWFDSFRYDFGCSPAVALSNRGWVVAMHKSELGNSLYYRVGRLDKFSKTIEWRQETKLEGHLGTSPAVRFPDMDGLLVELSYLLLPSERKPLASSSLFDEDDHDHVPAALRPSPASLMACERRILTAQIVERSGDWGIEMAEGRGPQPLVSESPLAAFRSCALLPGEQQTAFHIFQARSILSELPVLYYSIVHGEQVGPPLKLRFRQLFFVEAQIQDETLLKYDASTEAEIDGKIEFVGASLQLPAHLSRYKGQVATFLQRARAQGKITRVSPVAAEAPQSIPAVNYLSTTHPSTPWYQALPSFLNLESTN